MNLKQSGTTEQDPSHRSDLLTVKEASDLLRLKVSTIRAWVLQRRVPFVKLGGKRVLFRRQDLDALVASSIVPAKTNSKAAA